MMPGFHQSLMGFRPICDAGFTVTFLTTDVIVCDKDQTAVLAGRRDPGGTKIWHFNLQPKESKLPLPTTYESCQQACLVAFRAYDLPSVEALVNYLHTVAGFPIKAT